MTSRTPTLLVLWAMVLDATPLGARPAGDGLTPTEVKRVRGAASSGRCAMDLRQYVDRPEADGNLVYWTAMALCYYRSGFVNPAGFAARQALYLAPRLDVRDVAAGTRDGFVAFFEAQRLLVDRKACEGASALKRLAVAFACKHDRRAVDMWDAT